MANPITQPRRKKGRRGSKRRRNTSSEGKEEVLKKFILGTATALKNPRPRKKGHGRRSLRATNGGKRATEKGEGITEWGN